ncbi:hypothetical protein OIE82_27120 [Streptomyces althioticus]|uniref:Tail terminator n=1 Tax=Streptomyces althioticus TaxID=83380 RepID=A0ABZ1YD66_9ACTN
MSLDPMSAIVAFLRSVPEIPAGSVTGDMNAREVGITTVYVYIEEGYQVVRDAMDRIYVAFEVYSLDREEAAELSLVVRKHLLQGLRHVTVGDIYFLDAHDEEYPNYEPDASSREHVYSGVVSLYHQSA